MYWRDIEIGKHIKYENKGYIIVSAGHRDNNDYFLDRLKTIIELSDMTISNSLGTHVGYCVFLGKPHHIYSQEIKIEADSVQDFNIEMNSRGTDFEKYYSFEKMSFNRLFSQYKEQITKEQINLCNKYWGFDEIKSKEELYFIFDYCEKMFNDCSNKIDKDVNLDEINNIYYEYTLKYLKSNSFNNIIMESLCNDYKTNK